MLFTAAVILLTAPKDNNDVTSASKGRWPPEWAITSLPLSHYKQIRITHALSKISQSRSLGLSFFCGGGDENLEDWFWLESSSDLLS